MRSYILTSSLRAVITMILVMTIVFVVLRLGPLDPAQQILGDYASADKVLHLRSTLQIDTPIRTQYLRFLRNLGRGDFGRSFYNDQPVASLLLAVLPKTMELVLAAVSLGIALGIPPGILAALRPNTIWDHAIRALTLTGTAIPIFVTGIVLIYVFSLQLDLLPAIGGTETASGLSRLVLPALSCAIIMMSSIARLVRASLLDVFHKDYVRVARAKGVSETAIVLKHALRPSLLPLVTYLGIQVNILLGSAVLVEVIFTRPGVGRLVVEAIKTADFPVVQTILMLYAGAVVLINLLVDVSYILIDPRVSYR